MSAVENCLLKKTLFEELEKSGIFNVFLDPLKKKRVIFRADLCKEVEKLYMYCIQKFNWFSEIVLLNIIYIIIYTCFICNTVLIFSSWLT